MIDLNNRIEQAIRENNTLELKVYRNLKSEVQKYETSKGAKPLTDAKQIEIFFAYYKELLEDAKQFAMAGRDDLVRETNDERLVVSTLIPESPTPADIVQFTQSNEFFSKYWQSKTVENLSNGDVYSEVYCVIPKKDMGACIKHIKQHFPTADGKEVSTIIKSMII